MNLNTANSYHNYKNCPLCGEIVSKQDRKCKFCEKNLVQQAQDDIEGQVEESKKLSSRIKQLRQKGLKNCFVEILGKLKVIITRYLQSEHYKNHCKVAKIALIIFVVLNILIFWHAIGKETKNAPYPKARAFMVSAATVNVIYIFSLKHIFGWDTPVALPFSFIRDALYNKGLSLFPKDEGEKEIWWLKIRWNEFVQFDYRELIDYTLRNKHKLYSKRQIEKFFNWNDEVYSHIEQLAKAKISDPAFRKEKLSWFVDMADSSHGANILLYQKVQIDKNQPLYFDEKHIQMFEKVYKIYVDLKEYSKKYEIDSYDYYLKDMRYREAQLEYDISDSIVTARFATNTLNCNDPMLTVLNKSHKELREYYTYHKKELLPGEGIKLQLMFSGGITTPDQKKFIGDEFRYCPALKDYVKYFDDRKEEHKRREQEYRKKEQKRIEESNRRFEERKRIEDAMRNMK